MNITDAGGRVVALDGVTFAVAPDGMEVTVTNRGDGILEVTGEQAGEPLLRLTASDGAVNEASQQAAGVAGTVVDPDAAAELIDLVWGRVEPRWVPLPQGGSVSFVDHRAAPGHPPDRSEFRAGQIAGEWRIRFTYDGAAYEANGHIAVVETDSPSGAWRWMVAASLAAVLLALYLVRRFRHS